MRHSSCKPSATASSAGSRSSGWRIALIRLLETSSHFEEKPYLGWMYVALILGGIAIAGSLPHSGPRL
jgi:hypothetical protein